MSETLKHPGVDTPINLPDRRARFFGRKLIGSESVVNELRSRDGTVKLTTSDGSLFLPYTRVTMIDTRVTSISKAHELETELNRSHQLQPSFLVELRKIKIPRAESGTMLKFHPPFVDGLWNEMTSIRSSLVHQFGNRVGDQEIHVPVGSFTNFTVAKHAAEFLVDRQSVYSTGAFMLLPIDAIR